MISRRPSVKKRILGSVASSWPAIALLCGAAFLSVSSAYGMYERYREAAGSFAAVRDEEASLAAQAAFLEGEIARFGTEGGVETELRRRYSAVEEGEQMVLVIDDSAASATPSGPLSGDEQPWWKFWK